MFSAYGIYANDLRKKRILGIRKHYLIISTRCICFMSLYKHYLSVKNDVPSKGYWDMYLIDQLFDDFIEVSNLDDVSEALVIAGAYQFDVVDKINKELSKLDKCVVIVTSDEENKFPVNELNHPNCKVYMNYPNGEIEGFPIGMTPHTNYLRWVDKDLDLFLVVRLITRIGDK